VSIVSELIGYGVV